MTPADSENFVKQQRERERQTNLVKEDEHVSHGSREALWLLHTIAGPLERERVLDRYLCGAAGSGRGDVLLKVSFCQINMTFTMSAKMLP